MDCEFSCKFILHKETVIKKQTSMENTYYKIIQLHIINNYTLNIHAHSVQFHINPQKSAV